MGKTNAILELSDPDIPQKRSHHICQKNSVGQCYTSKTTCIEFIKALADETKWIVKVNLEVAGTYSILINECKDNAGHEELALCFRYVNQDGNIEERFYEMV